MEISGPLAEKDFQKGVFVRYKQYSKSRAPKFSESHPYCLHREWDSGTCGE